MKEIIKTNCEVCGRYFETPMCLFFYEVGYYCPRCQKDYGKFEKELYNLKDVKEG